MKCRFCDYLEPAIFISRERFGQPRSERSMNITMQGHIEAKHRAQIREIRRAQQIALGDMRSKERQLRN